MKIALLTPTFNSYSGIDRVVENQAEDLIDKGHEVTIFALEAEMKPKRARLFTFGVSKNLLIQRIIRLFYFISVFKISAWGDAELKHYDQVISHFYPMNWYAIYAKKKYKIEYVYWDYGVAKPETFTSFTEKIYIRFFNLFNNYTIRKADKVVSISKYLSSEMYKELGIVSEVEYPIIDEKKFYKDSTLKADYPLCLYVGRISPHKGIHLLLDAFRLVLQKIPNAKLKIVGKKTFDNYFDELAQKAGEITNSQISFDTHASDEDIVKLYRAAHIYVTATQWEGYDMPIKEAELCGTPAVAFDIGPHKEVLKDGELVPNKDVQAFANAVIRQLKGGKENEIKSRK